MSLGGARWTQVVMGGWKTGMGRFRVRQFELEVTFRIQVKVSSVLLMMYLLCSPCGLILNHHISPLRAHSMFFSVIRECSHNFSNSSNCSSWQQIESTCPEGNCQ